MRDTTRVGDRTRAWPSDERDDAVHLPPQDGRWPQVHAWRRAHPDAPSPP